MVEVKQGTEGPCPGSASCHLSRALHFGMFCLTVWDNKTPGRGLPSRFGANPTDTTPFLALAFRLYSCAVPLRLLSCSHSLGSLGPVG